MLARIIIKMIQNITDIVKTASPWFLVMLYIRVICSVACYHNVAEIVFAERGPLKISRKSDQSLTFCNFVN